MGQVIRALERSESGEACEHALLCLWSALGDAFIIGSRGTLSDNSRTVVEHVRTATMRAGKLVTPTARILAEVVDKHPLRRPGDEVHPYKTAGIVQDDVNRALAAEKLGPVGRHRIADHIKAHPIRS